MSDTVTISGRLHADPDLHFTNSGAAVGNLTVIVTTGPKKDGEKYAPTGFFDVVVWGSTAENVAESLRKGDRVIVSGKLQQRTWEDQDGNKRSKIEVVAFEIGADLAFATVEIREAERTGRKERSSKSSSDAPDWS